MTGREPRVMMMPDGGILNVDVNMLQLGVSKMRSTAEGALIQLQRFEAKPLGDDANQILKLAQDALEAIVNEGRSTLHEVETDAMLDDVEQARKLVDSE